MGSGSNYQEFLDKRRVEKAIMQSNAARFHLMEHTPPLQDPLLSDLSYLSIMEASKQILVGTYVCPLGVDDFTRDFLSCLQISQNIPPGDGIHTSITKDNFQRYWWKAQECTSSSVLGLNFGHYKAVARNDLLSEMHAVFTDITVTTGFSPTNWFFPYSMAMRSHGHAGEKGRHDIGIKIVGYPPDGSRFQFCQQRTVQKMHDGFCRGT